MSAMPADPAADAETREGTRVFGRGGFLTAHLAHSGAP
jgi:hypothetical protein